jgi:hypothetical protein
VFKHNWETAEGTVIDLRFPEHHTTSDGHGSAERFVVEVRPQSGEPFRVELGFAGLTGDFKAPATGQVVKMKCNPEHTKAEWDTDADPNLSWKAEERARKERFEQELHTGS